MVCADAGLLRELTGSEVTSQVLVGGSPEEVAAEIRALPADIGAVLFGFTADRQGLLSTDGVGGRDVRPVLSERDAAAVVLGASALRALARLRRRVRDSRLVVAGAREVPLLSPILMASGVGDLTVWNAADATIFPLHHVLHGADVAIDLLGGHPSAAYERAGIVSLGWADAGLTPFVTAGLLRAGLSRREIVLDIEVMAACARALAPMALPAAGPYVRGQGAAAARLVADVAGEVCRARVSR